MNETNETIKQEVTKPKKEQSVLAIVASFAYDTFLKDHVVTMKNTYNLLFQSNNREKAKRRMPIARKLVQLLWLVIFIMLFWYFAIDNAWFDTWVHHIAQKIHWPETFLHMLFGFGLMLLGFISFMFIIYTNGEWQVDAHKQTILQDDDFEIAESNHKSIETFDTPKPVIKKETAKYSSDMMISNDKAVTFTRSRDKSWFRRK